MQLEGKIMTHVFSAREMPEKQTHLRRCPPGKLAADGGSKRKERLPEVKQKKEWR